MKPRPGVRQGGAWLMQRCVRCESLNPYAATFCRGCGEKLTGVRAGTAAPCAMTGVRRNMELENAPAAYWKGLEALSNGEFAGARQILECLTDSDPAFAPAYAALAAVCEEEGLQEKAAEACRKALELDPSCADYHYLLGRLLSKLGCFSGACKEFERTVELEPGHVSAWTQLARLALARKDYSQVELYCREACRLSADTWEPHFILAEAYREAHRWDEAAAELRCCLGQPLLTTAHRTTIHTALGDVYAQKEDWPDAVREYQNALHADGFNREARQKLRMAELAAQMSRRAGRSGRA